MNGYVVASLVLLVVAAGLLWGAWSSGQRHKRVYLTESIDLGTLRELHRSATEAAGPGAFRQLVDIEGTVHPGPDGPLEAPLTHAECVWHRHSVMRRYQVVQKDAQGRRTTQNRDETESELTTENPFVVHDASGEVVVVPSTGVDCAEQSLDDFKQAGPREPRGTVGRKRCEWLLRPGTLVFVHGEAVDQAGSLVILEPEGKDKLLVSTRSETEVLASAASGQKWMRLGGIAAAVVAVVLGVFGVAA